MLIRFFKKLLAERPRCDCGKLAGEAKQAFEACEYRAVVDLLERVNRHCGLDAEGACMLGTSLVHDGKLPAAEAALTAALSAQPGHLDAIKMLAMRHLLAGDWTVGFRLYESMRHEGMRRTPLDKPDLNRDWLRFVDFVLAGVPPWRGESLEGKSILVWSEHGRGDAIMTMRLVPELYRRGARLVAGMSDLAEKCLFEAAGIPTFHELEADWKPAPEQYDFHCSIFSLLHLLGVTPDRIPGQVPYLKVPEERIAVWRERLETTPHPRVGLVWGGNPLVPYDKLRSLPFADLRPLLAVPGIQFVSLQKDGPAREEVRAGSVSLLDMMDECADFMDTAALIRHLDLVISVDSAVAHLAGAVGTPVWLMNRYESEWRWMRGREDTVWYPGMRLFNQPEPRQWAPVVARMADELRKMTANTTRDSR